jgi:hypothetical protein
MFSRSYITHRIPRYSILSATQGVSHFRFRRIPFTAYERVGPFDRAIATFESMKPRSSWALKLFQDVIHGIGHTTGQRIYPDFSVVREES